ncbi:polypeptide N-acetylgalactosaminyltransferase 5-like [Bradysia coprophila]|uniref:polypeptide N-acetylgalactosaminyltransferase 5-like n=1 Tax=Bradysia coprophila TaxID=38358 RepID=UPI00187D8186|nr:polypeptide N-acetylgalactosaminyltransferase 5-like [Bradysia coprophila]
MSIKRTNHASVQLAKTYPNYYDDDLRVGWPFQITKNYDESNIFEWSEPIKRLNRNRSGFCEEGAPFVPPENMKELMETLMKEHNFNLLASDLTSLHRSLPDPRFDECKNLLYPKKLPMTSVIIIFHNEAWTTLLRTVWSIIDRSPVELIKEIILVDDLSTWSFLKRPLDDYIETIPVPVKLIRNSKREGLMRARTIGAQHATGQVLTFLDAHIECCEGWLQPLLARIASDRSVVAVPLIDALNSYDMSYSVSPATSINGFHWSLVLYWMPVPEREIIRTHGDKTAPVRTPMMIGCAFSIDNEFFFEIGAFDEGMDIWGSENVEIAVRVWRCGGSVEILPCSRVGHLYRSSTYSFDGDVAEITSKNNIRLVEIWMPDIRDVVYAANPGWRKYSGGNMTDRMALQRRLSCRDLHWYFKNIYPESGFNNEFVYIGEVKNKADNRCLDTCYEGPMKTFACHHIGGNQLFVFTKTQKIVSFFDICMGVDNNKVVSVDCSKSPRWKYDNETKWLVHVDSERCIQNNVTEVLLTECNPNDETIEWEIISAPSHKIL